MNTQEIQEGLIRVAKKHHNMMLFTMGSGKSGVTNDFTKFFPEKVVSFGVGDNNMFLAAAGAAARQKIPVLVTTFEILQKNISKFYEGNTLSRVNMKVVIVNDGDVQKLCNNVPTFGSLEECMNVFGPCFAS